MNDGGVAPSHIASRCLASMQWLVRGEVGCSEVERGEDDGSRKEEARQNVTRVGVVAESARLIGSVFRLFVCDFHVFSSFRHRNAVIVEERSD